MKKLILFSAALFATHLANADTVLGIYAGMGIWNAGIDGDVGVTEPISTDELGIKDEDVSWYYVALEHPVPILPNIRISQTNLDVSGSSTLSQEFTFDDETFTQDTDIQTKVDLSHTDYTLYYEILDNYASLDIGLTARAFDGVTSVTSELQFDEIAVDETIPMLYGRVQIDLPVTGFYVGGTLNYVGLDDNSLQDLELRVGYMTDTLPASIGVELGYRKLSLTLEEEDEFQSDVSFDGSYAAVVFHF